MDTTNDVSSWVPSPVAKIVKGGNHTAQELFGNDHFGNAMNSARACSSSADILYQIPARVANTG